MTNRQCDLRLRKSKRGPNENPRQYTRVVRSMLRLVQMSKRGRKSHGTHRAGRGRPGYPRLSSRSPNGEKETELSPLGVSVIDHGLSGKRPLAHFGNTGLYFTDSQERTVIEVGGASTSAPQLAPIPEITSFNEKGQAVWHAPGDRHKSSHVLRPGGRHADVVQR